MSRNGHTPRAQPATPVRIKLKTRPRRVSVSSSSLDLSDDDGYSAVEEISDDEDEDEEDVTAVEEENILANGLNSHVVTPRPPSESDDEEYIGNDHGLDIEDDDGESWNGIVSEVDQSKVPDFYQEASAFNNDPQVERHVRFDIPSSDSDSTETEDDHADMFPDIFISQNSLDPAFRREINNNDAESFESWSFWDHHGQYRDWQRSDGVGIVRQYPEQDNIAPLAPAPVITSTAVSDFDPSQDLDGYESESCLAGRYMMPPLTLPHRS